MLETHRRHVADATVAVIPVAAEQTSGFGILKMNQQGRIVHFDEKPPAERLPGLASEIPGLGQTYLASMGIYIFGRAALEQALSDPKLVDFGKNVIPDAVPRLRLHAHLHRGYWEDVGTIESYYQANLALCRPLPPFDFYEASRPVYTHPRFLAATKIESCRVKHALLAEGSILIDADVERAVVGIRSRIGRGARVEDSLILGADYHETLEESERSVARGIPAMGIGAETVIRKAIVDKNARIGRGVKILNEAGLQHHDGDGYYIREGIVVVPKNAVIPDGTLI
jgi:glucose-1-phosphate adenylyltransferase